MTTSTALPVTLIPRDPVAVRFAGDRGADGPMTLGQLNIWQWFSVAPEHAFATIPVELEVPDGTRIEDVTEVVAVLLARHEGLRTTYADGEPPTQRVIAEGVLRLNVYSVHVASIDRATMVGDLVRRSTAEKSSLPFQVAIAVAGGDDETVVAAVAVFSHLAADYLATEIVRREFAEMVRDRSARQVGAHRRHQPLDQVMLEHSARVRRQNEQALDHWRDLLSRMPRCLYATPMAEATDRSMAVELSSVAAGMALRRVIQRTRTSPASVVLAAVCAVLACRTGYRELVFPTISSNRFERHLTDYVGTLAQSSLIAVDTGGGSFDRLVRHTWAAALEASRHGRYDVYERIGAAGRIERDRGVVFDYEPLFNNATGEAPVLGGVCSTDEVRAARSRTRLRRRSMPASRTPVRFDLYQVDGVLRLVLWSGDAGRVSYDEVRSLLLAVESLLVSAAAGDLDDAATSEAIGLTPMDRDADWLLVDSCWVELAAVQCLLDDAVGPGTARVFPTVDGRPLVAYLVPTDAVRDSTQAHARCMAALRDHPTAITPRHYVMCDAVPR